MKTVLVVEDERMTQRYYLSGLRGLVDWKVAMAESVAEAMQILEQGPVNVLVTDLQMPRVSGGDLIRTATMWYPGIPIIVVSAAQDPSELDQALSLGAMRIHPKPIRLSWLMDEIRGLGDRPPHGRTEGVPLSSMLQILQWERGDCTLTVRGGDQLGRLYVKEGHPIQAGFRGLRGVEAALRVLDLPDPKVEFVRACRVEAGIFIPLTELLMEHSLRRDHASMEREPLNAPPGSDPFLPPGQDPWRPG